nr:ribonuclease H-like domain, reverse transcriptase, RNA-dependent DNA polymerase [Tanacetum cinerariifolium]
EVDVHVYRSMIGSLMYLTSSRPDIIFVVCACARYQVNPKVSHIHAVKKNFRQSSLEVVADEEGIDCLTNSTIFEQLALMRKLKRKNTQVPHPSNPTDNVADETVHKELGDSLMRAATTASSLEAEHDSDETVHKELGDSLMRAATTPSSLEAEHDSGNIIIPNPRKHLMNLVPKELIQVVVPGAKKP